MEKERELSREIFLSLIAMSATNGAASAIRPGQTPVAGNSI